MDEKTRLRELIDIFSDLVTNGDNVGVIFELNGWEGLLVWDTDGMFYQFSYKNYRCWSCTMFPYDIYGKKVYEEGEWHERRTNI